jgi:hypothetical protein
MLMSVPAFAVVLVGVIFYCWFLGVQQRRLSRSVEMLQRLRDQTDSTRLTNDKAT